MFTQIKLPQIYFTVISVLWQGAVKNIFLQIIIYAIPVRDEINSTKISRQLLYAARTLPQFQNVPVFR